MIDLIDVSKSYGPGLPAVNHANLHIDKGEFVFVVGNSGSGKTTLIKLLMKELDSTSGQTIVSGERLETQTSGQIPSKIRCSIPGFPSPERQKRV
jgi:cell division transport system ATP-binding protein